VKQKNLQIQQRRRSEQRWCTSRTPFFVCRGVKSWFGKDDEDFWIL